MIVTRVLSDLRLDVIEPVQIVGRLKQDDFAKLDDMVKTIVEKHKSLGLL